MKDRSPRLPLKLRVALALFVALFGDDTCTSPGSSAILESEAGLDTPELCRKHGISQHTCKSLLGCCIRRQRFMNW
jgi:hypothetical protein